MSVKVFHTTKVSGSRFSETKRARSIQRNSVNVFNEYKNLVLAGKANAVK